ncbi:unnamed protein product [Discosporangium mesarthrocarpum]
MKISLVWSYTLVSQPCWAYQSSFLLGTRRPVLQPGDRPRGWGKAHVAKGVAIGGVGPEHRHVKHPSAAPIAPTKQAPTEGVPAIGVPSPITRGTPAKEVTAEFASEGANITAEDEKLRKKDLPPENTAAEKVLSLFKLGLVEKEEIPAYFEAISTFEKVKQAPTEAPVIAAGVTSAPSRSFSVDFTFPSMCAILGVAGVHSLHLPAEADTVASTVGLAAGFGVGVLFAASPGGSFASNVSKFCSGLVSSAVEWVSRSVMGAVTDATEAATLAAQETFVKAPSRLADTVVSAVGDNLSAAGERTVSMPSVLADKVRGAAEASVKGVTTQVATAAQNAAMWPVRCVQEAGEQVRQVPVTVVSAIPTSPEKAGELARGVADQLLLVALATAKNVRATTAVAGKAVTKVSQACGSIQTEKTKAEECEEGIELEMESNLPVNELDLKMSLVRGALNRFDALKDRLSSSRTSSGLLEAVRATRNFREKTEKTEWSTNSSMDGVGRVGTAASMGVDEVSQSKIGTAVSKTVDKVSHGKSKRPDGMQKRKQVADRLLEQAMLKSAEERGGKANAAVPVR